jgi:hypothetical protein
MKSLNRIGLALLFFVQLSLSGFAQSGIITTYAGPALPVNGTQAITQAIDYTTSVAPDGAGGFYVASMFQNRVYRVTADGRLSLVAGTYGQGYSGDGGPATSAQLNYPRGVAVDTAGNLFIADSGNSRVRKVTPGGVISTVAGNGTRGFSGNGGPATLATLSLPEAVAVDTAGNLFIADSGNNRVRKVTPGGVISTVAGNGTQAFSSEGGPATSAQLWNPTGVAVDAAGNLFIADSGNNRVRKVTSGGVISTVAGNGTLGFSGDGGPATSAQLTSPYDLAVDTAGNLFIADERNNRVRKVTPGGVISTVAGNGTGGFSGDGGPATSAELNIPYGVAVDTGGNLFIADTFNNRIRKVTPGGVINTVAGNGTQGFSGDGGPATSAQLHLPTGVAVDTAGNLFIADRNNHRIRKVTPSGVISTVAGNGTGGFSGDGGPATSAQLNYPTGVAVDTAGNLFIADSSNSRVRKVTSSGVISTVAGNGTQGFSGDGGPATSAQLLNPTGVAVDTAGNLFIASFNNRVRKVTPAGGISTVAGNGIAGSGGDGGPATSAQLNAPSGVAVDTAGNLFIADSGNSRVRKVTSSGVISTVAGNGTQGFSGDGGPATSAQLNAPSGVAVDTAGNLFIASFNNCVRKVTPSGVISTVAGNGIGGFSGDGGPATSAQLNAPSGVAVDTAGNLFIADERNNRIRKVTPGLVISTVAGNGSEGFSGDGGPATAARFYFAEGVAVDTVGNLFIADSGNNRVRKVTPDGMISTVAGNGIGGFGGDGGPATSAQLNYPTGVGVDTAGNLFIADTFNSRVRKVTSSGVISTVAGNGTEGFSGDGGPATSAQLLDPTGVAVDTAGNLFIADRNNHRLRKVTPSGVISTVAGNGTGGFSGDGGPATSAQLNYPTGVAVDTAGDLFIADSGNSRVRKVTSSGGISTVAGNGIASSGGDGGPATSAQLLDPTGVAVDTASNLFIASFNNRVRKVTPAGGISTVAGNGIAGSGGDGGPATSAQLNAPSGVAVDTAGNLFIADSGNSRVRKVTLGASAPTFFPQVALGDGQGGGIGPGNRRCRG